ncbi:DUF7657 domain-containing protein [Brachyspira pilosicoli]|uniref:DUF7657 domain-containing protein n=1 Tax=Brachyspira pilosicoli TaxID=52584 RepID=A0A5C8EQY0_BRAPL|nr:hypothetical protein [Brachyspira pilosicoli]TXJ40439.1 hypothetical protein EPJ72_08385 [Brachyspira pilosicoli]
MVSDKIIDFEKIDNVNYILKIKKDIIYLFVIIAVLIFVIYYLILFNIYHKEKFLYIINYINRYRFAIAAIVFILCIIFEISGSSMGIYSNWLNTESGVIFGESRGIRSDEWKVLTPFMLSQYENHTGKFPYFSDTIRGDKTDVYMVYGLPVMAKLDDIVEQAFNDQCTGANPVYPLMKELKQIYLDAYNGVY